MDRLGLLRMNENNEIIYVSNVRLNQELALMSTRFVIFVWLYFMIVVNFANVISRGQIEKYLLT